MLVNNAAIFFPVPIPDFTVDKFDHTIAVNLRANFLLCQGVVEGMKERGWGAYRQHFERGRPDRRGVGFGGL